MKIKKLIFNIFIISFFIIIACNNNKNKTTSNLNKIVDTFNLQINKKSVDLSKFNLAEIVPFNDHGKWGWADKNGRIFIPCQYLEAGFFHDNRALFKIKNKYGFINLKGEELIQAKYTKVSDFNNGVAKVYDKNYCGLIDTLGNIILDLNYQDIIFLNQDTLLIKDNHQWGTITTTGKRIIAPIYSSKFKFTDNLAVINRQSKVGIIDKSGNEIIKCKYHSLDIATSDLFIARIKYDSVGIINSNDQWIIKPNFTDIKAIDKNHFIVKSKHKGYGLINAKGDTIININNQYILSGNTNLLAVKAENKCGYISLKGDTILPFIYSSVSPFYNDIAIAAINNKFGLINYKGDVLLDLEFSRIDKVGDNLYRVYKDDKHAFYKTNTQLTDFVYTDIEDNFVDINSHKKFKNQHIAAKKTGNIGFINNKGEEISTFKYHWAAPFNISNTAIVYFWEKYGIINNKGKQITPFKYDELSFNKKTGYYYCNKNGYISPQGKEFFKTELSNQTGFNIDTAIQKIRDSYKRIKSEQKRMKKFSAKLETGDFAVLYDDDLLTVTNKDKNTVKEYYFDKEICQTGPFFIFEILGKVKKEYRHYFYENRIIRSLNPDKKEIEVANKITDPKPEVYHEALSYLYDMQIIRSNKQNPENLKMEKKIDKWVLAIEDKLGEYESYETSEEEESVYFSKSIVYKNNKQEDVYIEFSDGSEHGSSNVKTYFRNKEMIYREEESEQTMYYADFAYYMGIIVGNRKSRTYFYNGKEFRTYIIDYDSEHERLEEAKIIQYTKKD